MVICHFTCKPQHAKTTGHLTRETIPDRAEAPAVSGDAITPAPALDNTEKIVVVETATESVKNVSDTDASTVQSSSAETMNRADPMDFGRHRRHDVSKKQMKIEYPRGDKRKMTKFYTRQNQLIDQFLGADDEERLKVEELEKNQPRIKFAIWASFVLNFCLFVIQLYAAVSTGSLALFATATDAFVS